MLENIEVIEPVLFTGVVADEIVASIQDAISERGKCSLVLSGGSTPGAIYRLLAKPPRIDDIEWDKVKLFWGDERFVAHDHSHSNYRMTNETLLSQLNRRKPNIYPVKTDFSSAKQAAEDYENEIRKIENLDKNQLPVFDIVLLGIGEDGHTASLFPNSTALTTDTDKVCTYCEHPDGGQRVSLTQHALFNARKIFFIVKGASKAEVLAKVISGNDSPQVVPARFYLPAKDKVTFFVDSEAAQKLEA